MQCALNNCVVIKNKFRAVSFKDKTTLNIEISIDGDLWVYTYYSYWSHNIVMMLCQLPAIVLV